MRIYLIGFMGAGKSFWGRQLSQHFQAPFFDLDDFIVQQENKTINSIFETQGEQHFRLLEKNALIELSEKHNDLILATGGGTPCYHNNIHYMNQMGKTIWLNPPIETLVNRLSKEKDHRPLLRNLDNDSLKSFIHEKLASRIHFYQQSQVEINDDASLTIDKLIKLIQHA